MLCNDASWLQNKHLKLVISVRLCNCLCNESKSYCYYCFKGTCLLSLSSSHPLIKDLVFLLCFLFTVNRQASKQASKMNKQTNKPCRKPAES